MKRRVVRFVSVGLFNTVFDFVLLNLLVFVVDIYKIWANVISVTAAMSVSYLLNHSFVFQDKKPRSKRQYVLFLGVTAFGLLIIQNVVIYLFTHQLVFIANTLYEVIVEPLFGATFSQAFVQLNVAKALATIATMIWNYELYRKLIFKTTSAAPTTSRDDI